MSPFLDWLTDLLVFPGLPVLALLIGGWVLFRQDNLSFFLILNIAVIILIGVLALLQPNDNHAPVPGMIVVIYAAFYVPAHLLLMGLMVLVWHLLKRRRAVDSYSLTSPKESE